MDQSLALLAYTTTLSINNNKHIIQVYCNIKETEGNTSSNNGPLHNSAKNDKIPPYPHLQTSTIQKRNSRSETMDELLHISLCEVLVQITTYRSREEMIAVENKGQKIMKVKDVARQQMTTILEEAREKFMKIFDG